MKAPHPLSARVAFCGTLLAVSLWTATAQDTNAPAASVHSDLPALSSLPQLRSPVDTFRRLLAMTPTERKQFLANRPPEAQRQILVKLREYQSLKPDERELRLRTTELQWYLFPLMSLPATNRPARLALIPAELRPLVEERLALWNIIPPQVQEQLLDDEMTSRYFTRLQSGNPADTNAILHGLSAARRAKLEAGLDRWRRLSEDERRKITEHFNAFFELTADEKEQALSNLSEAEKQQMEKTLQTYENLSPEQRQLCLRSFEKFVGMSVTERQLFLKNAERWKLMSPAERQTWRELVHLAPLTPDAAIMPSLSIPGPRQRPERPGMATNN